MRWRIIPDTTSRTYPSELSYPILVLIGNKDPFIELISMRLAIMLILERWDF